MAGNMKNQADYSRYKCPYSHLDKECGHELKGPQGFDKTYGVWCACGFRGPVFYLDPKDLRLELIESSQQTDEPMIPESFFAMHILRNWDKERIDSFARHLLGDKFQQTDKKKLEMLCYKCKQEEECGLRNGFTGYCKFFVCNGTGIKEGS